MRQLTLGSQGFVKFSIKTRKAQFLEDMDQIIPWSALVELIEPYYPKPQGAGRSSARGGGVNDLRLHDLRHS